jgi:uncharacterized protein
MPHILRLCLAVAWALVASTAVGQTATPPATIVVQGQGRAERAPDAFFIAGSLRGDGADQLAALRALAEAQASLNDGLTRLDGLTGARLRTDSVSVEPVYSGSCRREHSDREGCSVSGYVASARFQFKGAPASLAGNAVSLAAEFGARDVATNGVDVEDRATLRSEANRLAFADASAQAEALAQASGRRIVRILRVQDANARDTDYDSGEADEIVVTGSRIRPTVAIAVDQPPVVIEARLNIVFEIE